MEALYILVPLSLVLIVLIGAAFWWSATSGQFEELEREGERILADEEAPPVSKPDDAIAKADASANGGIDSSR